MKKLFALFVFYSFLSSLNAQNIRVSNPGIKNYFSFQMQAGFNKAICENTSGQFDLSSATSFTPSAIFQYNFRVKQNFELFTNIGYGSIGYLFFDENAAQKRGVYTGWLVGTQKASLGFDLSTNISHSFVLKSNIGYSIFIINPIGIYTSGYVSTGNPNELFSFEAVRSDNSREKMGRLVDLSLTISRKRKNGDFVDLTLGRRIGLSDALVFDYENRKNTPDYSTGLMINRGSEWYLGLGYSFLNTANKEEGRQERKRSLEKSRSEMQKINASVGFNSMKETLEKNNYFLAGWSSQGISVMLETSKPFKNYDLQAAIVYNEFWTSTRFYDDNYGISSSNLGQVLQFNIGFGKELVNKKRTKKFGELKAGAANAMGLFGRNRSDILTYGEAIITSEYPRKTMYYPLLYAGFETSFRLYNQLYFITDFTYYQGVLPIYKYNRNVTESGQNSMDYIQKTNGTYYTASAGIAVYF